MLRHDATKNFDILAIIVHNYFDVQHNYF